MSNAKKIKLEPDDFDEEGIHVSNTEWSRLGARGSSSRSLFHETVEELADSHKSLLSEKPCMTYTGK